jgi:hypothetical protein
MRARRGQTVIYGTDLIAKRNICVTYSPGGYDLETTMKLTPSISKGERRHTTSMDERELPPFVCVKKALNFAKYLDT